MNYPVLASVPGGYSSPRSPLAPRTRQGFGDGRPISRATEPRDLPFIVGVKDAARWLGIHHDTLRDHAAKGKVPCLRIGNRICFRRDELMASLERGGRAFLKK